MNNLFESEVHDKAEIERLSSIVDDMRRAGIKLRNQLSDLLEVAKLDNDDMSVFPKAQEAIREWNETVNKSDLGWKEDILTVKSESKLIL